MARLLGVLSPACPPTSKRSATVTEAGSEADAMTDMRALGRKGGKASGKARRRLTLDRVERELGPLDTIADAQRWLRTLGLWGAAGLVPGAVLGACVRSVDVWLRGQEQKLVAEDVEALRQRLGELEAESRKPRVVK